ncbi:MAG: type II toxin-antitoxin system ParD family antitoxin [Pseudorhizobium sp.]
MKLNISLNDHLAEYVDAQVKSGRFGSSAEVVEEALRLMEARNAIQHQDLDQLRDAWRKGEESGDYAPLDIDSVIAEGRSRMARKA